VDDEDDRTPENATTNVVDFMALLKKSLGAKTRTPAKKDAVAAAPVKKTATKKTAAKKTAAKKAPVKKTAARKTPAKRRRAG